MDVRSPSPTAAKSAEMPITEYDMFGSFFSMQLKLQFFDKCDKLHKTLPSPRSNLRRQVSTNSLVMQQTHHISLKS